MSHVKLKLDEDFYLSDTIVFGLITEMPPHRLAYFLNQELRARFTRTEKDKEVNKGKSIIHYPMYQWYDEAHDLEWILLKNKITGRDEEVSEDLFSSEIESQLPLLIRYRKFDYILYYQGDNSEVFANKTLSHLRKQQFLRSAEVIDTSKNPQSFNILFI